MSKTREMQQLAFSKEALNNAVNEYINGLNDDQSKEINISIVHQDGAIQITRETNYKPSENAEAYDALLIDKFANLEKEEVVKAIEVIDNLYSNFCANAIVE